MYDFSKPSLTIHKYALKEEEKVKEEEEKQEHVYNYADGAIIIIKQPP